MAASAPLDAYGNPQGAPANTAPAYPQAAPPYRPDPAPGQLAIQPGSFVTVRLNQPLSSDYNQQGDTFVATLASPLVVDGVVVARRGQTVAGRVTEAVKAGRVKGTSRLGLELTELTLADGQRVPVRTQLILRGGGTSHGTDAAAIGTTAAMGAAIGAAVDWGTGAAIGAGAGAAAGLIGVLLTRGHPTEVYPETALTFRVEAPVPVNTDRAPQAFQNVQQSDYEHTAAVRSRPPTMVAAQPAPAMVVAPGPYYGWYGPGWYGPAWYGPAMNPYFYTGFYFGRGYYYGGRGYYHGGWHH